MFVSDYYHYFPVFFFGTDTIKIVISLVCVWTSECEDLESCGICMKVIQAVKCSYVSFTVKNILDEYFQCMPLEVSFFICFLLFALNFGNDAALLPELPTLLDPFHNPKLFL